MFYKKVILIGIVSFFSACTPMTSTVYSNNSVCTDSIVNGALKIAWKDYDLPDSVKEDFFTKLSKPYINYFHNKEFNNFYITLNPHYKDAKERKYYYYIQKNSDGCWAKLYKKEIGSGSFTVDFATGSILTIDSYKLDLCNCSDTSMEIGF